jgi:DNA repair photolyase
VDVPDLHFKWTVNPYRGCEHGCIYCYARPTHEYAGLSSGLDFETTILAKHDAPEILRRELAAPAWRGEPIMISGVTDPYQPVERELRITRRVLELMVECRQAISLITKNRLVTRDLDLLRELHVHRAVHAAVSVTTLDNALARVMEPRASSPGSRLETIRALSAAGLPVAVMVAPVIPGLTDHEIPRILHAAREAGAVAAGCILLRLPHQIKSIFLEWIGRHFPDRAAKVESLIRQTRGGALYDSRMFVRQRGEGEIADAIRRTFEVFAKRHGLGDRWQPLNTKAFRRPIALERGQLGLFERPDTLFG